jgi:glycyl-tRNA synthetase alpha subunit
VTKDRKERAEVQMSTAYDNEANEFFFQDKDEEVCVGIVPASEVSFFQELVKSSHSLNMKEARAVIMQSHTLYIALSPSLSATTSSFALEGST